MKRLTGVGASPGTAVAPAYAYRPDVYEIPTEAIADQDKAAAQLDAALDAVAADLDEAATASPGTAGDILRAQAQMARDVALRATAIDAVRAGAQPARAVLDAGARFAAELEATGNEYLAARSADIRHICDLAARALVGAPARSPPLPVEPCVIVADDLSPADTVGLDPAFVRGIVTAAGSRTSHTAVVARGLGIPAVVGVRDLLESVPDGVAVGVDGTRGVLVVAPDAAMRAELDAAGRVEADRRHALRAEAGTGPAVTRDGHVVEVAANIRGVEELRSALSEGADGVGLLRTELLYIDHDRPPSQEDQEALLRDVHAILGGKRLVVRTFDIGADKPVPFLPVRAERNPELGVRGIRLAQAHPELLETQLRAIAATAHLGPTAVMAPMVATLEEVRWFVARCHDAGMPSSVEIGMMLEVPSLSLVAEEVALEVDFLSIGTNDLTQYLHAADRRNGSLAALQDPFAPAVLRAVDLACRGAQDHCWVGVCGEAASDPGWALIAVGLGVSELSMQPAAIPAVRAAIRRTTLTRCRDGAARAVRDTDPGAIRAIAAELMEGST